MLGKFCSPVSLKRQSQQSIISMLFICVCAIYTSAQVINTLVFFRYGEQAGRVTGDAMGAVANAVEVCLVLYIIFIYSWSSILKKNINSYFIELFFIYVKNL